MSSSEKRYFKRNALIGGDTDANYLKLFDALNKMKNYEEKVLRKKPFIKHFGPERKYLYEAILRSLRNYNSDDSIRAQISDLLLDATYLYERGLYDQSQRRLKIAQRLVRQIDYLPAQLEINNMNRRLLHQRKESTFITEMESLIKEKEELLVKLQNELTGVDISDRLLGRLWKNYGLDNEKSKKALEVEFKSELEKLSSGPLSEDGERYLLLANAFYHQLLGDFDKMEVYLGKVLEWWNVRPIAKRHQLALYINSISNYLAVLFALRRYQLVPDLLQSFDELKPNRHHDKRIVFKKSSLYKLIYYLNTGEVIPIRTLIPEIEAGVKLYRFTDSSMISLEGNIVIFHFLVEEWEACDQRMEKILKGKKDPQREDVQRLMRILSLITNYELGNINKVESGLRTAQRYFEKTLKSKEGFEFEILAYFRKLIKAPILEQKECLDEFESFLAETTKERKDVGRLIALEELMLWIKSKQENRPLLEVYRQKIASSTD